MLRLEEITKDAQLTGLVPGEVVKVVNVEAIGLDARLVAYRNGQGKLDEQILFRQDEYRLVLAVAGKAWAFDADPAAFKLALEAYRISLAHLFDPLMAVHTSNVEPLPHQISAVYEAMLPRQPLRFVLADDPGAGKTVMAGLLIREMMLRADARRVLIVSPGSLTEQWQDELHEKFGLDFELFSREKQEQCRSRNYFAEQDCLIARLDQLSRNDDYQHLLAQTEWDLIVVDEAHKMSASYFGNKVNETGRFKLGKFLGGLTRHYLLMTATPHNGKEEDFQLFMSLLDGDRFYGKFREGAHKVDITDMMRRMVKEELLRFDGRPLFPERCAYTVNYTLSDAEVLLYDQVTDYVRNEMNRADRLDGKRKGTVGFALTQLQRRLASSPQAIYTSLTRRRKKLQARLDEVQLQARADVLRENLGEYVVRRRLDLPEDLYDAQDELSADEYEAVADQVVDQATASETIPELQTEIAILQDLEAAAASVVQSRSDRKWEEFSRLLQDRPEMRTTGGRRRKLIVFTEHRDTLNYLLLRIRDTLGSHEAVVTIHGGTNRDDRRKTQEAFRNDPDVLVLVATDAAGEGVNLQNANLMVNYDLPWNPNRMEQRFGRIHRIGQREVCHLWNLVAAQTREGEVFKTLLDKLAVEHQALGGRVFNVLGEAFDNISLKDLLIDAIRYGEQPETRARMEQVIGQALDTQHLKNLMARNALVDNHMSLADLYAIREEMDKAEARKLQPHFISAFFREAFRLVGGELREREAGRYEVRHVPADVIERDRVIGHSRTPVLKKYERICFDRERRTLHGKPTAELIHPGHPLMAAVTDLVLSSHRSLLKRGAVLLDPHDAGTTPRVLFMLDHSVREAAADGAGATRDISRRLQFVEMTPDGYAAPAPFARHLDLLPLTPAQTEQVADVLRADWVSQHIESRAQAYAVQHLVPEHTAEIASRRQRQATKQLAAVRDRLVKEIQYWSDRAIKLDLDVRAGKQPRMQPDNARRRAEELSARLKQRSAELQAMQHVASGTPHVIGGALVVPAGLLATRGAPGFSADAAARARIERIAMQAVFDAEHALGHHTKDVSADKCGWDITATIDQPEGLPLQRHIEVKGRAKGQDTVTVTANEIRYGLNQKEKFVLAVVVVDGDQAESVLYIHAPFTQEPDWAEASKNLDLGLLLQRACTPQHYYSQAKAPVA
ncbi:helicase-related protein [Melaminivora jejuensis]|uniref:helicase-related protein n=1 Tax=Melaminivora jejuensis TaxID=1267217 RepID=UPI001ADFB091|nr:helicase-related protein [Melaminivora jejuensis]UHJ65230.1 SNF2-related protein [Melaminivora jejuensis]